MKRIAMIGAMTMAASVMMAGRPSEELMEDYDPISGDKNIPDHSAYTLAAPSGWSRRKAPKDYRGKLGAKDEARRARALEGK